MKHLTKNQSLLVLILLTSFSLIGCASDKATSTSSTTTTATANAYFTWKDSQCYDSYSATYVNTQYCTANRFAWNSSSQCWDSIANYQVNAAYCSSSTSTTTGATYTYYWQNGACYQSTTGVVVASSYCGVTSTANQCYGYYYYYNPYYYQFQMIYCSGSNCKGYSLYTYGTSQQVTCG